MTPCRRGESIQAKWHVKRGFVKLHVIVDVSDGTILSAKLTDDGKGSGDSLQLEELLDDALEGVSEGEGRHGAGQDRKVDLLGDGAYGSSRNVAACRKRGVVPVLRLNVTSTTRGRGYGDQWGDTVREQLGSTSANGRVHAGSLTKEERYANQKEWMKKVEYGQRWRVEGVFSSAKRIQGEALWSRKVRYMKQEIRLRVAVHNLIVRMGVHV